LHIRLLLPEPLLKEWRLKHVLAADPATSYWQCTGYMAYWKRTRYYREESSPETNGKAECPAIFGA